MARELLFSVTKKDFEIQTFCSGGPGGQHQNKVESGVRIVHKASGAVGESREERSQHANKKIAFDRLTSSPKFQAWCRVKANEIMTGESIEQKVEKAMVPKNIKLEVKGDRNKWITADFETIAEKDEAENE